MRASNDQRQYAHPAVCGGHRPCRPAGHIHVANMDICLAFQDTLSGDILCTHRKVVSLFGRDALFVNRPFCIHRVHDLYVDLRNVIGHVGYLLLMLLCGVEFPVAFLPAGMRYVAALLPLTNGLKAIRALLSGAPAGQVLAEATLEAAAGCGWLALAFVLFRI